MLNALPKFFARLFLIAAVIATVTGCGALQAAIPGARLAVITGGVATDAQVADAQQRAESDCRATLAHIPLVEVNSGEPTLAAAYAVSGPELDRYLSDQASRAGVELGSTGWASDTSEDVSMCLFDGDFLTNTPGPPGHDRSAVRVLVVVANGKARLWSVTTEKSALPATDPGSVDR